MSKLSSAERRKRIVAGIVVSAVVLLIGTGVMARNGWFPSKDPLSGERTGWFGAKLPKNAPSSWKPQILIATLAILPAVSRIK